MSQGDVYDIVHYYKTTIAPYSRHGGRELGGGGERERFRWLDLSNGISNWIVVKVKCSSFIH